MFNNYCKPCDLCQQRQIYNLCNKTNAQIQIQIYLLKVASQRKKKNYTYTCKLNDFKLDYPLYGIFDATDEGTTKKKT